MYKQKGETMGLFVTILSFIGQLAANIGSTGCVYIFIDEPECPKSLIK